jgi:hypothetical protein
VYHVHTAVALNCQDGEQRMDGCPRSLFYYSGFASLSWEKEDLEILYPRDLRIVPLLQELRDGKSPETRMFGDAKQDFVKRSGVHPQTTRSKLKPGKPVRKTC